MIETFQVLFTYEQDSETGDIKCIDRQVVSLDKKDNTKKSTKKKNKNECSDPQIILEDNKYCLNSAAVELLNVEPENKLSIKYVKDGKSIVPSIELDEKSGNRLTKSFTVSCRGKGHDELANYGTVFTIEQNNLGVFLLKGDKTPSIEIDNNVEITDLDIEDFTDDDNLEEISIFDFDLN